MAAISAAAAHLLAPVANHYSTIASSRSAIRVINVEKVEQAGIIHSRWWRWPYSPLRLSPRPFAALTDLMEH